MLKSLSYLKMMYPDCLVFYLKKNILVSDDVLFQFFSIEELKDYSISYVVFDGLKMIDFHFYSHNCYFLYTIIFTCYPL